MKLGMRLFAVTYRPDPTVGRTYVHFLVEAADKDAARKVLAEELGPDIDLTKQLTWSASDDPRWRSAWRHGQVKILKPTKLPTGVE